MEIFRACCGSNMLKAVDDANEINNSHPKLRHNRRIAHETPCKQQIICFESMSMKHPVNITRIKCHEGDDSHPSPSDSPQHTTPPES